MRAVIITILFLTGIYPGVFAFVPFNINQENDIAIDSSRIYNNLGIESYRTGDFEQADALFRRSLEIKRPKQGPLSSDMATTYSNLGAVNRRLNNIEDAMLYYDTAGYIFLSHSGPDNALLGAVYQNQGNLLREQMDYNSALSYYYNALRIFLANDRADWAAALYNNIGIAYWGTGDVDKAREYYYRSIDIRQKTTPLQVAMPAGNLANSYRETGEMDIADHYFRMSIHALREYGGDNHPNLATSLMNYGIFLVSEAVDPEKGYEMILNALNIFSHNFGYKDYHVAMALMNIGYYYELKGNPDLALDYYQKSLIANSSSFNSANITDNPGTGDHAFSVDAMLRIIKRKADAHYSLSAERDYRSNLESSLAAYKVAMEFIEMIRMGPLNEESRLILSENEHETFMQAIHIAWELYKLTENPSYIEEAFLFSERSKAASLLASIRNLEARSFGGVPEDMIEKEQNLKRGIAAYRELIYEEMRIVEADQEKITFWQERVFSLEMDLRQLIGQLEQEYPDYYALKYNPVVSSVKTIIDHLGPRDAMVSYVYNDSLVYIFVITDRDADFFSVETGGDTENVLTQLLDVLTSGNLDRKVSEDFRDFTNSARYLFKLLMDPAMTMIKNKRLIIVPDGLLSYVPFELLLMTDRGLGGNNYRELSYLLRDFPVSYSFSATIWQESIAKTTRAEKRLLSMAPQYEFSEFLVQGPVSGRQNYRDNLVPLPAAKEEAVRIAGIMNGDVLLDQEATEHNFKQMAGDYRLLHLAMHTLIDDVNPMFSKLVFAESETEMEDGFLNTYEIYNLNLNAGLTVLSSCRSGYGTLNRGEGVMSLARGFLYAGVPSIVMTNWEIEDKSGAEIMISFYRYLLKGYRKDEALRKARIDFLDNTDMLRSHPYFWGAYVCIGNPDELFRSYRHYYPYATFILLVLLMMGIIWRVSIRKS